MLLADVAVRSAKRRDKRCQGDEPPRGGRTRLAGLLAASTIDYCRIRRSVMFMTAAGEARRTAPIRILPVNSQTLRTCSNIDQPLGGAAFNRTRPGRVARPGAYPRDNLS
ncbi:MAG: hypothetical protein OHK0018_13530 [Erythrobacter tepidarius]